MGQQRRYKQLASTTQLKKLITKYYALSRYHRLWGRPLKRPLAWVTSGAPVELLRAFKIHPVYPEQYAALCSTGKATLGLCQAAEAAGYSPDLCSYATSSIGTLLKPDLAPMQGLPKPDLVVACNNICGTVLKWYEALARSYQVPLVVIDTPFLTGDMTDHAQEYVLEQFKDFILQMEKLTGRKFNPGELAAISDLSNEVVGLWKEIRGLCQAKPSPLNGPDLFIHMAPIVVLRGTREAVGYYKLLKDEVKQRAERGESAIEQEKIRLVWDNIAIWSNLFKFFKMFSERGACFVTDTYTGGWSMEIAPGDPLESLAATYTEVFLNRSPEFRTRQIVDLIKEFKADGFVMHSNRSCKPYSLVQEVIRKRVMQETGVPGLMVEADMADPRAFAEEPIRNRVQAFLETLSV